MSPQGANGGQKGPLVHIVLLYHTVPGLVATFFGSPRYMSASEFQISETDIASTHLKLPNACKFFWLFSADAVPRSHCGSGQVSFFSRHRAETHTEGRYRYKACPPQMRSFHCWKCFGLFRWEGAKISLCTWSNLTRVIFSLGFFCRDWSCLLA